MEIFKAVEIPKEFEKKHCKDCIFAKHPIHRCEAKYLHECTVIDIKLEKLGSPCSHCAFIIVEGRELECEVHNCPSYDKWK